MNTPDRYNSSKIIKRTNKLIQFTCANKEIYYGTLKIITRSMFNPKEKLYWCDNWINPTNKRYESLSYDDMTYISSKDIIKIRTITKEEWKKLAFMAKILEQDD